jgi:hypothetical protein
LCYLGRKSSLKEINKQMTTSVSQSFITYKKLAKKLIPKDFYMEDSMGIRSTDLTHKDILLLDSDLFTSLEALEKAVFKRLTKLGLDAEHDIRVLLDSTGSIYLAIEK